MPKFHFNFVRQGQVFVFEELQDDGAYRRILFKEVWDPEKRKGVPVGHLIQTGIAVDRENEYFTQQWTPITESHFNRRWEEASQSPVLE